MKKGIFIFFTILFYAFVAQAAIPIATDSRIKTFIYNESEVFHLTVHYGYQSNIEFAKNEEIETMSMGNSYSWKITPVGRRLFIKALEGAARTNMTIITNKRTYQFELESKNPDNNLDDDLVYVARFYLPDKSFNSPRPRVDSAKFLPQAIRKKEKFNFNYTLSGANDIAPTKVFDDGAKTFLKFSNNNAVIPHIFIDNGAGGEVRASFSRQGEYIVIKRLVKKLILRLNQSVVQVFNESV